MGYDAAANVVLVGGTGTGKTHLATALGVDAITRHGKRVRFHSTVDLANELELEKAAGKQGRLADKLMHVDLVILDELNIALRYDYLDVDAVVAALSARRPDLHVVVTGRNAKAALLEAADLVTEMTLVKHHFAAGVKAQQGIEF